MGRTLKDIAEELNISITTVSRVVNNKEYVSPEKRKRVLAALKKYNYIPNEVARSLKGQSTKTIGIIIPDFSENFFINVVQGIDEVVSKYNYSIILSDTHENEEKEDHYLKLLYQKRIDALVLATVARNNDIFQLYRENNIPIIFIDNLPDIDSENVAILIDNVKASQLAIEHLLSLGHERIALIAGSTDETTGYDRLEGYKKTLSKHGIEIDESLIKYGNYKEDSGYSCMKSFLENRNDSSFTSIYVTSSKMTIGAIKAIREEGLKIPEDLSIIGFDFYDKTGLLKPKITTIIQPEKKIGNLAGDFIIRRLEEKRQESEESKHYLLQQTIILEPQIVPCESSMVLKKKI